MKYQIGDKVWVRPDLTSHIDYYMEDRSSFNNCPPAKLKYAGEVVTIASYRGGPGSTSKTAQYRIEEDNGEWGWTDEMFEGLAEPDPEPASEPLCPFVDWFDELF